MPSLLALLALTPGLAFEPPAFDPAGRLHIEPENTEIRSDKTREALGSTRVRIFAVVTAKASDPRHADLPWGTQAEAALERTWEAWSADARFDPATDVLVFVALSERETRIRAGSEWDAEYGLHNEALTAITEKNFVPKARAGDLDGALAQTITATDDRFSSLRDLPAVLPEPSSEGLSIWPDDALLPRVASGRTQLEDIPGVTAHIAQKLPEDADPAEVAKELAGEDPDALVVLWDVRGDRVEVELGANFEGLDPSEVELEESLSAQGRDDEGHLISEQLGKAAYKYTTRLRKARAAREFELRKAWSFPVRDEADALITSIGHADLPATRAALDSVDWPLSVVAVDRADVQGDTHAPGGRPWIELVGIDADRVAPRDEEGFRIIATGDPRRIQVKGPSSLILADLPYPMDGRGVSRAKGDPHEDLDAHLAATIEAMDEEVQSQREAILARQLRTTRTTQGVVAGLIGTGAVGAGSVSYLLLLGRSRRRREAFMSRLTELTARVEGARSRLDDFRLDEEMRELVRALRDRGPETRALYAEITEALDTVEVGTRLMERRLTEVQARAQLAEKSLRPGVWDQLEEALLAPLLVEPAEQDEALFSPIDERVEVDAFEFMQSLNGHFERARQGWALLLDAARARLRRLEDDLDRTSMNEVGDRLRDDGIDPTWLRAHPYTRRADDLPALDALRGEDPVAYVRALGDFNDDAAAFEAELLRLRPEVDERDEARERARTRLAEVDPAIVFDREHDPHRAAQEAERADGEADRRLTASEDPVATIEHLDLAQAAWEAVEALSTQAATAFAEANRDVDEGSREIGRAQQRLKERRTQLRRLSREHGSLEALEALADEADADLDEAKAALGKALADLAHDRFVGAWLAAQTVAQELVEHTEDLRALIEGMDARVEAKKRAEKLLARLDDHRVGFQKRLKQVRTAQREGAMDAGDEARTRLRRLADDPRPDWVAVLSLAQSTRSKWENGVSAAEAEARAIRAAEAARAAAAARRRAAARRSSYSSSSRTSSSSSWSSSSSSSSWSSSSSSRSSSGGSSWSSSSGRSGGSSYGGGSGRSGGSSW